MIPRCFFHISFNILLFLALSMHFWLPTDFKNTLYQGHKMECRKSTCFSLLFLCSSFSSIAFSHLQLHTSIPNPCHLYSFVTYCPYVVIESVPLVLLLPIFVIDINPRSNLRDVYSQSPLHACQPENHPTNCIQLGQLRVSVETFNKKFISYASWHLDH